jgi:NhaP-type Na+/H+ or K+/H+ antiporter
MHDLLLSLTGIVVLGVMAQWISWRLRVPSILLLLSFGILAGPVAGWIDPDEILGPLLLPVVSLSVAVILFEGGLSLKIRELRTVGGVVLRLTTLGVIVTGIVAAFGGRYLLHLDWPLALALGAILVVTGPTVIGPLIRHLRLGGQVGSVLKWEGIVIDPVGAVLAVLVFAAVRAGGVSEAVEQIARGFCLTAVVGGGLGIAAAWALVVPLRRYWIPDSLQNIVTLAVVFGAFSLANVLQREAGLLAVTIMGVGLASQRQVTIKHLVEFKENLSLLLVSSLFMILAARLKMSDLRSFGLGTLGFLLVLIFVARPLTVMICCLRSSLSWRERLFLAAMAPRGIVAAAVTSVFALELKAAGFSEADRLVPITFVVIITTVLLYGLIASTLARRLRLATPNPQGVLFVGAHRWARELANALQREGCSVKLIDSDWANISAARQSGLATFFGSILAEHTWSENEFGEFGYLLALTANDEANSLACLRFTEIFGRRGVYQLPFAGPVHGRREPVSLDQRGRLLFGESLTHVALSERFGDVPTVRATQLTSEFDFDAFCALHGDQAVPLFLITQTREVIPFTILEPPRPKAGETLISAMPTTRDGAK